MNLEPDTILFSKTSHKSFRKDGDIKPFIDCIQFHKKWFERVFHFVKIVRIRSFSGPYFPAFGLNTKVYSVILIIHSECGKIRSRKTPNTDTFDAVFVSYV